MKLRKRTILAVAFGIAACTAVAHADQPRRHGAVKAPAPVVMLPGDTKRVIVPTPLGGPSVAVPVRNGIDVAGAPSATPVAMAAPQVPRAAPAPTPKVVMPVGSDVPAVRTREAGPVVNVSP